MLKQRQLARRIIRDLRTGARQDREKSIIDSKVLIRRQGDDTVQLHTMPSRYFLQSD